MIDALRAYKHQWYLDHKAKTIERAAAWAKKNPAKRKILVHAYDQSSQGKLREKIWYAENRKEINKRRRIKRKNYERQVFADKLRTLVRNSMKGNGARKAVTTEQAVGCTIDFLRQWIANQFKPGMSWDNHGLWHVDHIRPCSTFNLTDPMQQRYCFHFTNLQPLWAKENISKGAQWIG